MRGLLLPFLVLNASLAAARSWPYPRIAVDPGLELLAIVHVLAGTRAPLTEYQLNDSIYAEDVAKYFLAYSSHPAVDAYLKARRQGLDILQAQELMLSVGVPIDSSAEKVGNYLPKVSSLLQELSDFSRKTRFLEFFESHRADYERWVKNYEADMKGRDYASMLEEYSGLKISAGFTIFLCPLRHKSEGNLNHVGCAKDGGQRIFSTIGPSWFDQRDPRFEYFNQRWSIWHELGHAFFDRPLEKYPELVNESRNLFDPIARSCYGSWPQCIREHVVQGIAFRMLDWAKDEGRETAPWAIHTKDPMPFIELIGRRLKEFEARRDRYPTLMEFYPRLLEALADEAKSRPGLRTRRPPVEIEPANSDCRQRRDTDVAVPPRPPENEPGRALTGKELKERGVWRFLQGDTDSALKDFEAALKLDASDAEAYLDGSVALFKANRLDEALRHASLAAGIVEKKTDGPWSSLRPDLYSTRASIWEAMNKKDNALRDLQKALQGLLEDSPRRAELETRIKALE